MTTTVVTPVPIDLAGTRFEVPASRPGLVRRTSLLRRLRSTTGVVAIAAPAGYGATTLLDRWSRDDDRTFAYVALDTSDDDPRALLASVVEALSRAGVLSVRVTPSRSPAETIRRLGTVLRSVEPFVLAIDDVHGIEREDAARALANVAGAIPTGSVLALAGRRPLPVAIEPHGADAVLVELGPKELSLTPTQVRHLLRNEGVDASAEDLEIVVERTGGWPVAVYLAALGLRSGALSDVGDLTGAFRPIADLLRVEVLDPMTGRHRRFLERTAVLEPLNGAFCDTVLGTKGSAKILVELARAGIATPDAADAAWFHVQPLIRAALLAELERHGQRSGIDETISRAAAWSEATNRVDPAAAYAMEIGDARRVARLFVRHARARHEHGAAAAVHGWIDWLERRGAFPAQLEPLVVAGWVAALDGRAADAQRFLEKVERFPSSRSGNADALAGAALLRAVACVDGAGPMREDAATATGLAGAWRATALLVVGAAERIAGRLGAADDALADACGRARRAHLRNVELTAVSLRAEIATRRGDHRTAEVLLGRAVAIRGARLSGYATAALSFALAAGAAVRRGDDRGAQRELAHVEKLVPALSYPAPWLAVVTLAEVARAQAALDEGPAARRSVEAIDAIRRRRPDLGSLGHEVDGVRSEIDRTRTERLRVAAITRAEMRVLRELPTYLTFGEIGKRLYVSPHTVKTQALSMYRKLGVSSRAEAIARARELDLLDA